MEFPLSSTLIHPRNIYRNIYVPWIHLIVRWLPGKVLWYLSLYLKFPTLLISCSVKLWSAVHNSEVLARVIWMIMRRRFYTCVIVALPAIILREALYMASPKLFFVCIITVRWYCLWVVTKVSIFVQMWVERVLQYSITLCSVVLRSIYKYSVQVYEVNIPYLIK